MIENELMAIWQSSPKHERVKFEKSKLMIEMKASLDMFNNALKFRDLLEIVVAIIMMPFFGYQIYHQPNAIAKFGAIWILVYILFVIYKLLKAKSSKPRTVDSFLDYLNQNKKYLQTQKNLLDNVLYWYILPCLMGVVIMQIGILDLPNKQWMEILEIKLVWISLIVMVTVGIFVNWINKRAVKKEFIPRLKKIEELLKNVNE